MKNWFLDKKRTDYKKLYTEQSALYHDLLANNEQLFNELTKLKAENQALLVDLKQAREEKYNARNVVSLLRTRNQIAIREVGKLLSLLRQEYKLDDEQQDDVRIDSTGSASGS